MSDMPDYDRHAKNLRGALGRESVVRLLADNERLRARVAELKSKGSEVANAAGDTLGYIVPGSDRLGDAVDIWQATVEECSMSNTSDDAAEAQRRADEELLAEIAREMEERMRRPWS